MANNFFLNQDPLLYQTYHPQFESEESFRKQMNDAMIQYKLLQQQQVQPPNIKDYIGDLDKLSKTADSTAIEKLNCNEEYIKLKNELMNIIQDELMQNIKWKININPTAIKNIERQTEIINNVNKESEDEQRKNINELNDYVKNYSNMTFDDYKQLKCKNEN